MDSLLSRGRSTLRVITTAAAFFTFVAPPLIGCASAGQFGQRGRVDAAYDNGYRRGLEQGQRDARSGRAFDFQDERDYQRADAGYNGRYGSRDRYRQVFREGYAEGYRTGYGTNRDRRGGRAVPRGPSYDPSPGYPRGGSYPGRGPYGRSGYGYGSEAFEAGFADGFEKGLEDARDRDRYDPVRHRRYRDGDRGYDRRHGSRDRYKNEYRDGFRAGYDQGYRDGGYARANRGRRWPWF